MNGTAIEKSEEIGRSDLALYYAPTLLLLRRLQREPLGDPAQIRTEIQATIDSNHKSSVSVVADPSIQEDVRYGLLASFDDVLSNRRDWRPSSHFLERSLVFQRFRDGAAGSRFYDLRLDRMLSWEAGPHPCLEVYLLCLSYGFRGKKRNEPAVEETSIVDYLQNMGRLLASNHRGDHDLIVASPLPREDFQESIERIPIRTIVLFFSVLLLGAWALFFAASGKQVSTVQAQFHQYLEG